MSEPILRVEDLKTQFFTSRGVVHAVDGISFHVDEGETVAVVGESGCGKTITALSVLRLVPEPGKIVSGRILFKGQNVVEMDDDQVRNYRGNDVAMIFQDPMTSLNPVTKVGAQIKEAMTAHDRFSSVQATERVVPLLKRVRVPAAENRVKDYPHQFSGGMRQRVMIAIALACGPDLLIADEPTTALDVTVQAEIIELMRGLCAERGTAVLMISHDLGLVANICRRVAVMYAGRIVEERNSDDIFRASAHP